MGAQITYDVGRHGIFPDVIGGVNINICSMKGQALKPISLVQRGGQDKTLVIDLYVYSTEGVAFEFFTNFFASKVEETIR